MTEADEVESERPRADRSWFFRFALNTGAQDWLLGLYFILMLLALAFGSGPGREHCIKMVLLDFAMFCVGILLTRGGILRPGTFANAMVYRLTVFAVVFLTYFQLREILPAVSSRSVDADIFAFDMAVFGVEPSLAWDRFVTPRTTEWFAFFYFGYFFILSAHVFPMTFAGQHRLRVAHFSLGISMLFCTGHLVYMLVPGYGPYRFLADQFHHPLEGGLFWRLVRATVDAGGAQKDIFPSLHTAAPTYFAIYSYIHRRALPFRYTWPFLAFAATQIIGATMFLRWHYLIDIFAGLTLATGSAVFSHKIALWEAARRKRLGLPPSVGKLEYRWPKTPRADLEN